MFGMMFPKALINHCAVDNLETATLHMLLVQQHHGDGHCPDCNLLAGVTMRGTVLCLVHNQQGSENSHWAEAIPGLSRIGQVIRHG